ncbi:MAG: C4-type zinc ribbon domain-containing protein [Corallococcus sp.]|nr:C4-type zinc ribbon domain-containing protein [Corallococcus sp.]MCM1359376.1 C4-type zinc ribbon domain-containing protein [Corallococcus sp.]MCM1394819.1 C4-type zinc ribbon domain-containing protein [Corallococcus sp.]
MIQQEMLQYQAMDVELNKIERDLKKNESFVKRKELKLALQKSEEQITRLDQKTAELRNQLEKATQTLSKLVDVFDDHNKQLTDIEDQDELNYLNKKLDAQFEQLAAVERDVKQILKDGEEMEKAFERLSKVQMPRLAAEYGKCNSEFEKATLEVKPRVLELRKQQAELKSSIDSDLFDRYKKLSETVHPVFVPLENGNRCGGCRMEMPSAMVASQMAEKGLMRCENCGRIIYKKD